MKMAEVQTQEEIETKGKVERRAAVESYWEKDSGVGLTGLEKAQTHTDKYLHKEK